MGRVQRKKIQKEKRRQRKYRYFLTMLVILIGIGGILVVDHSLHERMDIERKKMVEYGGITDNIRRLYLGLKVFEYNDDKMKKSFNFFMKKAYRLMQKVEGYIVQDKINGVKIVHDNRVTYSVICIL